MRRHRHRMVWTEFSCYSGPIPGAEQNPAAHGGITETQRCACGAVRQLNVNGRHIEAGPWTAPGEPAGAAARAAAEAAAAGAAPRAAESARQRARLAQLVRRAGL